MLEWWKKISRHRFARHIKAEIEHAGGPTDFVYEAESFMLKNPGHAASLGNVYATSRQARGARRQQIVDSFVSGFTSGADEKPRSLVEARDKIMAVVWERALLEAAPMRWTARQGTPQKHDPAHEPLSDWFARSIVLDYSGHISLVTQRQLKEWGLTFDEAFELGLARLQECSPPRFRQEGQLFIGTWQDDYDSSRALLPALFEGLLLDGDPVVTLPNRFTLLVTGSNDIEGLRAMLARAEQIVRTEAKPQNATPLLLRDGQLRDFVVPKSSPVFRDVQRNHHLAAQMAYQEQKAGLEKLYAQKGKGYFVASYTLHLASDGASVSTVMWIKNVPTLLPVADLVQFYDPELPETRQTVGPVPWPMVMGVLGELMLDTKMFPARFFVSKFPTAGQFKELLGNEP